MSKTSKMWFLVCVAAVFVFVQGTGCGRSKEKEVVLVSMGDAKITISDFNKRIENLPEQYRDVVRKRKVEFLQELINDTLLYQEAIRKGVQKDKDVQEVIEEARKKILTARLLKDEVDDAITVTKEKMQQFYKDNQARYMTPEVMRVSHILVPTREEAEKILKELEGGAAFDDLARAKSVDPTAQRGGDVGYFPKGQLMPEFDRACSDLDIGEISGVVKTKLGYHLIKLTDRKAPQLRPLEQVKNDVESQLRTIERRQIFNDLLSRLRKETPIKVNEEALSSINADEK